MTITCAAVGCNSTFPPTPSNKKYCCIDCKERPNKCLECGRRVKRGIKRNGKTRRCLNCYRNNPDKFNRLEESNQKTLETKRMNAKEEVCQAAACKNMFLKLSSNHSFCSIECQNAPYACVDCESKTRGIRCKRCAYQTPDYKKKKSELHKKIWANYTEDDRAKISENRKNSWTDERRQKRSAQTTQRNLEPEFNRKLSETITNLNGSVAFQDKRLLAWRRWYELEGERKITQYLTSDNNRGSNNGAYKGGGSKHPYGAEWSDYLRELIRFRDDYVCGCCNRYCGNDYRQPHVHHIDGNPNDSSPSNLRTVCAACHQGVIKKAQLAAYRGESETDKAIQRHFYTLNYENNVPGALERLKSLSI